MGRFTNDKLMIFLLENRNWQLMQIVYFENTTWHFMQIVSKGNVRSYFMEQKEKKMFLLMFFT